jgi:hypothetical protein
MLILFLLRCKRTDGRVVEAAEVTTTAVPLMDIWELFAALDVTALVTFPVQLRGEKRCKLNLAVEIDSFL